MNELQQSKQKAMQDIHLKYVELQWQNKIAE